MNKNTSLPAEAHLNYVPFSNLRLSESPYRFRLFDGLKVDELSASLRRSGQTHPLLIEEVHRDNYTVLDGYRRCDAVQAIRNNGGVWEKVLAQVVPSDHFSTLDRFHHLCERNLHGKDPLGLIERARLFKTFIGQGLTLRQIAQHCGLSAHAVEDHIELASAPPDLAALLNHSALDPVFALMLFRRFEGWLRSPFAPQTTDVARKLLRHAQSERITIKSWRFLLDFYWHNDRPFMA